MNYKAADLFGGAGGSAIGLTRAGFDLVWAGNHAQLAVAVHRANHPHTLHVCQDLHQADWHQVPDHDLLWASPACQGHSQAATRNGTKAGRCERSRCTGKAPLAARGSAPAHDSDRATAWAVVSAAEVHRPRYVAVENVTEFSKWVLYPVWRAAMLALDYDLQEVVIDAGSLGVPQCRKRLFLLAERGRRRTFRAPTARPLMPASTIMQLGRGTWRPLSDVPWGHQQRCLAAVARYGHEGAALVQAVTGHQGRSLTRPLPTITTKHQMGLVKRSGRSWLYRPLLLEEYVAGMGFRPTTTGAGPACATPSRCSGTPSCRSSPKRSGSCWSHERPQQHRAVWSVRRAVLPRVRRLRTADPRRVHRLPAH